jgi:periplasmic protein TonB
MKPKKNPKANVDRLRSSFFLAGIILSLAFVIMAFEWKFYEKELDVLQSSFVADEDEEIADITKQEQKPPPPEAPPDLEIVEDDEEIDEDQPELQEVDIDEDVAIDIPDNIQSEVEEEVVETIPFYAVEEKPTFPGGESKMMEFLTSNIKYPDIEKENGIQGLVVVSFIVNPDGSISNVQVVKGVTPGLNKEAVRVVKTFPKWSPGKQRNKAVKVPVNLPIRFTLTY